MKIGCDDFKQLISELYENANAVNDGIRRNDDDTFLLGKKEAYRETFETIKEITELTDHDIMEIRRKFPSYRSICFEKMEGISSELLKCFLKNNIHTVGQLAEYSGQDIFSILNKDINNVASLLVLYINNHIPSKYLNEVEKICDAHRKKRIEQIRRDLDKVQSDWNKISSDLGVYRSEYDQIKSKLDEIYRVSAIDFSDNKGNKSKDENAPMRIITITNSKEEQTFSLSAEEVKSMGIKIGTIVTIQQS